MDEGKEPKINYDTTSPITSDNHTDLGDISQTRDAALTFSEDHEGAANPALYHDRAYIRRLQRKVDLIVMPFFMVCYTMNFLDKVLLNVRGYSYRKTVA
jgi:hypothetical protein